MLERELSAGERSMLIMNMKIRHKRQGDYGEGSTACSIEGHRQYCKIIVDFAKY